MAQLDTYDTELACYLCDVKETVVNLYRCENCSGKKASRVYCLECGYHCHKRKGMNHPLKPVKTSFVTTPSEHEPNALDSFINDGKLQLMLAVGSYITSGTLEKFEKATRIARGIVHVIGASQGKAGCVSLANAVVDTTTDILSKNILKATAVQSGKDALESTASVFASTAAVSAAIFGIEMIYLGMQYGRGKVSWNELGRRIVRSASINTASFVGNSIGFVAGAAVGSIGGPVGSIIGGVIGAIIGAIAGGIGASAAFEKYWPPEEENHRQKMIAAALREFGYNKDDINNEKKFNKRNIEKKYTPIC